MDLEQETNNSYWKSKFDSFEVLSHWNKVVNSDKPNLKLNEYRLVEINATLFLEVSTQTKEITFLTDLKYFEHIQKYFWYTRKNGNTFYIITFKIIKFHRLIHPEWKMID